jgi:hypothetical protein
MINSAKERKDTKKIIYEENGTWPSCNLGMIFLLTSFGFCWVFYVLGKCFFGKEKSEIKDLQMELQEF